MRMEDNDHSLEERRRHKRFKTPGEIYTVFRAPHPMLGRIIDISEGGLSILYIEGDRKPANVLAFDLFTLGDDVNVKAIAAVSRSDHIFPGEDAGHRETKRRRGIEFIGLMDGEKAAVRELILKQAGSNGNGDRNG